MDERRYGEEAVRAILALAARRAAGVDRAARTSSDLTLRDVQDIAAEAGIPAAAVQRAASEWEARRSTVPAVAGSGVAGELREVRFLPGRASDAAWERTVGELRARFGRHGILSDLGQAREWISHDTPGDGILVRIEPDGDGGSTLLIRQNIRNNASLPIILGSTFALMAALLATLFLIAGFEAATALVVGLIAFLGAGSYGGGRLAVKAWAGRRQERLAATADRIEMLWLSERREWLPDAGRNEARDDV